MGNGHHDPVGDESALDLGAESVTDVADETGVGDERVEPEEKGRVAEAFERGGRCGVQAGRLGSWRAMERSRLTTRSGSVP